MRSLLVSIALMGAAFAQAPFSVIVKVPYEAGEAIKTPNDWRVVINSTTGMPRSANVNGQLCSLGLVPMPAYEAMDQKKLNQEVLKPVFLKNALEPMKMIFNIDSSSSYQRLGYAGITLVGSPKFGPEGFENARVLMVMLETTKGRLVLSCSVKKDDITKYKEELIALLDGVKLK